MSQPDPQLLSLLEKTANPLQNVDLQIKIQGIYAPPEQWKLTDQANPNIFTYTVQLLGKEFAKGKIQPRKLTEKELKEQQQKGKKGAKKQAKQEQKVPEGDPEEEERLRRQWDALSQQQKFHRTSEDPYKAFSLMFPEPQISVALEKDAIIKLETDIENDCVEVIVTRKPDMVEEEVQKLKKSKPKTLNIGQLYNAVYKGKVNLRQLTKPGATSFMQRVKIQFDCELPDECIKIEPDSCYVYLEITSSIPLTPEVKQIKPETNQIMPEYNAKRKKQVNIVAQLKMEICRSLRAISQEYITHFSKQKDHHDDKRLTNLSNISTLRLNEINKRKEIFLNQFMNSPKFTILKERIGKVIKAAVIDKFRKEKNKGPILKEQINSTLSEINLYFQEELIKVVDEFMAKDNLSVHEDLVLGYENSRQQRKQTIAPIINETEEQRQTRLAKQFQILHMKEKAEQNYINILILTGGSASAKEQYAKFCLKNKKFDEAYVLFSEIAQQSQKLKYKLIEALLLVNRRRIVQANKLLTSMIEAEESTLPDKIIFNLLLSFMYQREGTIKESEKYLAIAERYFKMKQNPNLKFHPPVDPYELPKAKVPKPERYTSQLSHSESQQIRVNFVNLLAENSLFNLIEEYLPKLDDSQKKSILEIQVQIFKNDFDKALQKIEVLLKKSDNIRNTDLLMTKADICYLSEKMFQSQEIFLSILQLKPNSAKILQIYLKLGFTYLNRKSWEDAKIVFEKACEQKFNCSMAWLGLGIAKLNLQMYAEAEQALNLSKIYNPLSEQTAQYQKKIDEKYRQATMQNYKYAHEKPLSL